MLSPTSETVHAISTLHALVRVLADHAVRMGDPTAYVAVYEVIAIDHAIDTLYPVHAHTKGLPPFNPTAPTVVGDPVTRAAIAELGVDKVMEIDAWVRGTWLSVRLSAEALVAVSEVLPGYRGLPPEQVAYRQAGRLVAAEAGESCVGIVWAGVCAEARYLRLYRGRRVASAREFAVEPVVAAARRELASAEKARIADWVPSSPVWERIDARAEELMAKIAPGEGEAA